MGKAYLSITQIAERSGLARNTIKVYAQIGRLPPADATIGRIKGWRLETIDNWLAQRARDRHIRSNGDGKRNPDEGIADHL